MSKEKIAIGFDLGTTSVGWSVIKINDNKEKRLEILDMGVRLFDDPANSDSNTEVRRLARGRRRRINRLKVRKKDFYKLLKEFKLVNNEEEFESYIKKPIYDEIEECYFLPVQVKIKGLSSQLSKHELILILHNYIKHRGTLNTIDLSEEDEKNKNNVQHLYDSTLYPCENQYEWFKTTGKTLGNKGNYLISNEDYKKEIKLILSNQSHLGINEEFISKFIELFERHRHYSEGPGSKNSPTPYGRFEKNIVNGKMTLTWVGDNEERGKNLWDLLIGKCTYYPTENRNYKKSPITELFNYLNDLANLKIFNREKDSNAWYLNLEEKKKILSSYKNLKIDKLTKSIGYKKEHIHSGLKKDSKEKFSIEPLKSTVAIIKWLEENNLKTSIDLNDLSQWEFIDNIFQNGVKYQNAKERFDNLNKNKNYLNIDNLNEEHIEKLAQLKIWSPGTSSLSKKAQLEFIKYSLGSEDAKGKNQMHFFNENENTQLIDEFSKYKYFPNNYFQNSSMPLTVKRTFNQTTKVLNAILKKYSKDYELSYIIIELARELNSKEEASKIERELAKNRKKLEQRLHHYNISEDDIKGGENRLKFLLWDQQFKQDIYDGQPIELKDLLSNPTKYHIDHILPISISFIDSMQNKVLTKATNNSEKGDKTPYQWLSAKGKYEEYKKRCERLLENKDFLDKKDIAKLKNKIENYLLYEKDPFTELGGFVERQLNDTRYISSEISNQLKKFFTQSNWWKNKNKIIINSVNGSLTSFARNNLFVESKEEYAKKLIFKNRDIYNHHAIDASIIAFLGLNNKIQNLLKMKKWNIKKVNIDGVEKYVNEETGEIAAEKSDFLKLESNIPNTIYFKNQMREFLDPEISNKNIKFSRMIASKDNTPLSNETLYSIRKKRNNDFDITKQQLNGSKNSNKEFKEYKITKQPLLELKDSKKLENYFGNDASKKEKLIIFQNEIQLYNKLNNIYKQQIEILKSKNIKDKNPFLNYLESDEVVKSLQSILNKKQIDPSIIDKIPLFDQDMKKVTHWIKELRIYENEVDKDDILTLKNHDNNAFYDSLKWTEIWIYKNLGKNKFETIFLNALNSKWDSKKNKMIPDESKIKNNLNLLGIDINQKPIKLKRGSALINNKDLYYVVGGLRKTKLIEIKALSYKNEIAHNFVKWEKAPKRVRWQIALSTIANEFKLCKVDPIGNVYDIKSFDEFFK